MAAKIVRLKLDPRVLAQIKASETRSHLQSALSKLPNQFSAGDERTLLDGLVFLLGSPLFLYTAAPRLRLAMQGHRMSLPSTCTHTVPMIDIHRLDVISVYEDHGWATKLCFGNAVLIEARELNVKRGKGCQKSLKWFCEEVEFLAYEYCAREAAAAELMGRAIAQTVKSKVVKLRVGRSFLAVLGTKCVGVRKRKNVSPKLKTILSS